MHEISRLCDSNWEKGAELRKSFEERLKDSELAEVLDNAPGYEHPLCGNCECCFGGCRKLTRQAPEINRVWCTKVNEELLHPAGYSCECHMWIESGGGNNGPSGHMQILIKRRPLSSGH